MAIHVAKTLYGFVEHIIAGTGASPKQWVARTQNGLNAGYYNTQAEARRAVQDYAGAAAPLTWTRDDNQISEPERWRGERITTTVSG